MAASQLAACVPLCSGAHAVSPARGRSAGSKHLQLSTSFIGGRVSALSSKRNGSSCRQNRTRIVVVEASASTSSSRGGFLDSFKDYFRNLMSPRRGVESAEPEAGDGGLPPQRTVVVVGSTGRTGRHVVAKLLAKGHKVVALVSNDAKCQEVLVGEMGLKLGKNGRGSLATKIADVMDPATLAEAFEGVDAVVCTVGARYAGGPPNVESIKATYTTGVSNVIKAAKAAIKGRDGRKGRDDLTLFDFTAAELDEAKATAEGGNGAAATGGGWERLDDVIMGGISKSTFKVEKGKAVFEGIVRVEGGGFCGARAELKDGPLDLSEYDGISLRVKGDGQRYKLNLRPQDAASEFQYQASFDTVDGEWVTVDIPFDRFRPVMRARVVTDSPPPPTTAIAKLVLLISRFEYDGFPNLVFTPGNFKIEVEKVGAYKLPRPEFVHMASAAVERFARLTSPEDRNKSIPIVKLNPGGILTWMLAGEDFLRASGLRYAAVRPCGLNDEEEGPYQLEVAQGDIITGKISREEVAEVLVEALDSPDVVGTTFEVRRDEFTKGTVTSDWTNLFRRLRPDRRASIVAHSPSPALVEGNFMGGPPREPERDLTTKDDNGGTTEVTVKETPLAEQVPA